MPSKQYLQFQRIRKLNTEKDETKKSDSARQDNTAQAGMIQHNAATEKTSQGNNTLHEHHPLQHGTIHYNNST
jgi:hypothetical protein